MTRGQPAVSVLVVTHNGARHIADTIDSVIAQTFDDWELIILDDGSTDATLDIVRSFDDPRIIVLPQVHLGDWGHWRNVMARDYARGRYIAPLDHDDLWLPDKLASQFAVLEAGNAVLSCTGWASLYPDGRRVEHAPCLGGDEMSERLEIMRWGAAIMHSSLLIRRSAFLDVGGYRGDPRMSDVTLVLGLRRMSPFAPVPGVLTLWRRHRWQTSNDDETMLSAVAAMQRAIAADPQEPPEMRAAAARVARMTCARSLTDDRGRAEFRACVRANPGDVESWTWLVMSYVPRPIMLGVRALYRRRPHWVRRR